MDLVTIYIPSISAIIIAFAIYIRWLYQYWKKTGIPYLEPSFPFGTLDNPITKIKPLGIYFYDFYKRLKQKEATEYGGIYICWLPVLIVLDPESIKQILMKDFQNFHTRAVYYNEKHQPISASIFTVRHDTWRRLRTKFTPAFTSAKMQSHGAAGKTVNVKEYIGRATADIIGSCAFGIDCNSFKDTTFRDAIKKIMEASGSFFKMSFCNTMPKLAKSLRILLIPLKQGDYIVGTLDETMDIRKKDKITRNDFLQLSMEMMDRNIITMDELRAQCLMFFAAGYETTINTLVFLLFELAHNRLKTQRTVF